MPRVNDNGARSKSRRAAHASRSAPGWSACTRDYLHGEYGDIDSDYVFVNLFAEPRGRALSYPAVYDLVKRLRRRTGIDFDPHWCRHRAATRMLRDGVPIEVVSTLLGHASVTTTLAVYGHLTAEDARRALEAAGWFTGERGEPVTAFEITHAERAGWQRRAAAELARLLAAHRDLPVIAWTVAPAGATLTGQIGGLARRRRCGPVRRLAGGAGARRAREAPLRPGVDLPARGGRRNRVRVRLAATVCDEEPKRVVPRRRARTAPEPAAGRAARGLLAKLMAAVRPEFRADVLVFDPRDPVFGGPGCAVSGCARAGHACGHCAGPPTTGGDAGRPELAVFATTRGPAGCGHSPLLSCRVAGCRCGRHSRGCAPATTQPGRAGRPELDAWRWPQRRPRAARTRRRSCRIAYCELWVHGTCRSAEPTAAAGARRAARTSDEFAGACEDDGHGADTSTSTYAAWRPSCAWSRSTPCNAATTRDEREDRCPAMVQRSDQRFWPAAA